MMQIPNRKLGSDFTCAPERIPERMINAPRIFALWHLLSLDAPIVALVWMLGFAWAVRLALPGWIPAVLVAGTWGIYLLDRILDARLAFKLGEASKLRGRHIFHWQFRRVLFPLGVSLVLFAIILAIAEMPDAARLRNGVLGAAALGYFCAVHARAAGPATARFGWLRNFKELFVALIFTSACVLPIFARTECISALLWPAILFAALAWLNCHAIEVWESRGKSAGRLVIIAALLLAIAVAAGLTRQPVDARLSALEIAAGASALLIASLQIFKPGFSPLALRIAADLALLTPLPLLIWSEWR